jgi:hypothetical protein
VRLLAVQVRELRLRVLHLLALRVLALPVLTASRVARRFRARHPARRCCRGCVTP